MADRVNVITGASLGIGAELARQLAGRGEKVVLAARREELLNQVADQCGEAVLVVVTDVTQRDQVNHLRDEALRTFGRVDVWVNNAGQGIGRPVLELTDEDFDYMMAVNCKSALYGMQAIVPHFQERGAGHLINISSALSRLPFARYRSAYSAAKAALNTLTTLLRLDLRQQYPGIHITLVMPPTVSSDFAKNARYGTPEYRGPRQRNMVQTPEEVATAILDSIDHPRPEVYTNAEQAALYARYCTDPEAFEAQMGG